MGWEMENNDAMAQASGVSIFSRTPTGFLHATPCRQRVFANHFLLFRNLRKAVVMQQVVEVLSAHTRRGTVGPFEKVIQIEVVPGFL